MSQDATEFERRVEIVRGFNRFYTRVIGVLEEGLLHSPFPLTEARVVYELAHHDRPTATQLCEELALDPGYMSRILRKLEDRDVVARIPSPEDGRQLLLSLTEKGRAAFAKLNEASRRENGAMLEGLSVPEQRRLVEAMETIRGILDLPAEPDPVPYILRPPHAGDMGWVVQRHGELYAREYGWNEEFEALVAGIVAKFMAEFDPDGERCWIAEREGTNVGCVFLVRESECIARLRLLLVEPEARGLGIGSKLVDECILAARRFGYRTLTLWTNSVLVEARRIYERAGFELVQSETYHGFGHDLVSETWELGL